MNDIEKIDELFEELGINLLPYQRNMLNKLIEEEKHIYICYPRLQGFTMIKHIIEESRRSLNGIYTLCSK